MPIPDCTETGGFTTPGSSPPIGSWDNYLDRSSYELGEDQFWHVRHNTWKIPIVTTDISDLELTASSSETSEVSDSVFLVEEETMAPSEGCNNAAKGLVAAKINLLSRIEVLDPDDIDQSFLHTIPGELDSIRDLLADFISKIISFQSDFSEDLDPSVVSSWQEEKNRVKKLVLDHKKLAWAKYTSLCPVKTLSHFEEQSLRNQTKQLVLQEASVGKTVGVEEKRNLGIAEVKYQALVISSKKILNVTRERTEDDLDGEEDEMIRKYMRELGDLKLAVAQFYADIKEFKEHTVIYQLTEDKHQNVEYFQLNVESKFDSYVKYLEQQDVDRALFTMETAPGKKVKWPKFSRDIEENFAKFKEKFELAAKHNRTSRTVQLAKLRECLSGYPLSLVPDTTPDIFAAFNKLTQLYGNDSRVLAFQKKKLSELGPYPSGTDNPRKKMEWLMDIQQILQEYIKLGDSGDSRMFCEAFSISSVAQFINAFPQSMAEKLTSIECDSDGRDQLEGLLKKVEDMRVKAQRVDIHNSLNPRPVQATGTNTKKFNVVQGGWERQKKELIQDMKTKIPGRVYAEINRDNLKVHKNCKICINAKNSDPA